MSAKHFRHDPATMADGGLTDSDGRHDEDASAAVGASDTVGDRPSAAVDVQGARPITARLSDLSRLHSVARYIQRRGGQRRSAGLRRALVIAGIVAAVLAVGATVFTGTVSHRLSSGIGGELRAALAEADEREPFYLLLVGVAPNEQTDPELDPSATLADAVILARVDGPRRRLALLSVPRDTLVDLEGQGRRRLNAAYALGGPAVLTRAVGALAEVPIAHYVEVDLEGLAALVDRVGGVDLSLPVDVRDPDYTGLDLTAGPVHADGYEAIMLARTRHAYDAYGPAEACRMASQRAIVTALARALSDTGLAALPGCVASLADVVTTDMDALTAVRLARRLRGLDLTRDVTGAQVPTHAVDVEGLSGEEPDAEAWHDMMARVGAGEDPYPDASGDATAGIACTARVADAADAEHAVHEMAVEPEYAGTVSALNATDVQGLAAETADALNARGFEAGAANAPAPSETSRVVYNGDDALAKAVGVAEVLGITEMPVANDGSLPIDANVVVVLGADLAGAASSPGSVG